MINLQELSKVQRVLRDRIDYKESDRFDKLILAFVVELGELANETRFFKFWSTDKEMRRKKALAEYVDNIHFLLDLGIQIHIAPYEFWFDESNVETHTYANLTGQFLWVTNSVVNLRNHSQEDRFEILVYEYLALGKMLGFAWDEIESAYYEKNKINHDRQTNGY